ALELIVSAQKRPSRCVAGELRCKQQRIDTTVPHRNANGGAAVARENGVPSEPEARGGRLSALSAGDRRENQDRNGCGGSARQVMARANHANVYLAFDRKPAASRQRCRVQLRRLGKGCGQRAQRARSPSETPPAAAMRSQPQVDRGERRPATTNYGVVGDGCCRGVHAGGLCPIFSTCFLKTMTEPLSASVATKVIGRPGSASRMTSAVKPFRRRRSAASRA